MRKFVCVFGLLLLAACSSDLTLPPKIEGIVAPPPTNLMVSTTNNIVYDLSWTSGDATVTSFYNLYVVDPQTGFPAFIDTTAATTAQVNTQLPTVGVVFGVAAVSTDNLEGRLVFGTAP